MVIRPINNRIVAKIVEEEPKKGSLLITNTQPNRQILRVVSACENEYGIKEGDTVLVDKYGPVEKEVDGERFFIVSVDLVLGVFE